MKMHQYSSVTFPPVRAARLGGLAGRGLVWSLVFAGLSALSAGSVAQDYSARKSGDWSSPSNWKPRGVPGAGDRVVSLGRHTITLAGEVELGPDRGSTMSSARMAMLLDGPGQLVLQDDATLTLHGHLSMTGEGASLKLKAKSRLLFAAAAQEILELQMHGPNQRVAFAGELGRRAEIGLAEGALGHWFSASQGHRDSVLTGAYGRVTRALNPADSKGWSMYLGNSPQTSVLAARHIEFRDCGQIGIFGLDAGEHTKVDLNGWSFLESHEAASGLPAFWFDGYGDVVVKAPQNRTTKRIRNLVSDKEIYVRYVQDYELENWVIGANGKPGSVRAGNNGGNALMQRDLFHVVRDSGGVGLLADITENVYMYSEADNPHGFDTRHLRGDALLRNFWFESHFANQSDTGDAILTNGPQSWVAEHDGAPVTLTVEHSGSIGDTSDKPTHPVFLTLNNSVGMRFRLRHNFMRQPVRFNAIALDENGQTPTGTGLEFRNNLVFSPQPVEGYALGSAAAKRVAQIDAFTGVDENLYFNLRPRAGGYPAGPLALTTSAPVDRNSLSVNPQLRDTTRNLAQWDLLLGGPGTATHAIAEMLKYNDDKGFNPAYQVNGLIAFVRSGFVPTNPELLDSSGLPRFGPALAKPLGATSRR